MQSLQRHFGTIVLATKDTDWAFATQEPTLPKCMKSCSVLLYLLSNIYEHMSDLRRTHKLVLIQVERHKCLPDLAAVMKVHSYRSIFRHYPRYDRPKHTIPYHTSTNLHTRCGLLVSIFVHVSHDTITGFDSYCSGLLENASDSKAVMVFQMPPRYSFSSKITTTCCT